MADIGQGLQERRVIVLRCEEVPVRGLLAPLVYQDLVGITDPEERKRRILDAAEGRSVAAPPPRPFVGVPPRIAYFAGRAAALDRIDSILTGGSKPAAITQASVGRGAVQRYGRNRQDLIGDRIRAPIPRPLRRHMVVPSGDAHGSTNVPRHARGRARSSAEN
jgi:hypothetical protein